MAKTAVEKYNEYLFEGKDKILLQLSSVELMRFERIRETFTVWLDKPEMTDRQIREYLETNFDIEKSQSYRDIGLLKSLLGNVRNAAKEWQRYTLIEMAKETYTMAKEKKDVKAMAMAIDKLGKYTNLDKEDLDTPNWDEYEPQDIEASDDVIILDIEPISSKKEKALRDKYLGKQNIEDATLI